MFVANTHRIVELTDHIRAFRDTHWIIGMFAKDSVRIVGVVCAATATGSGAVRGYPCHRRAVFLRGRHHRALTPFKETRHEGSHNRECDK